MNSFLSFAGQPAALAVAYSTSVSRQVIKRRSRGFICVNAHPEGCRLNVERQIAAAAQAPPRERPPRNVLVVGASTGYGLASRIAAGWGYAARTLGVFFERPPDDEKPPQPAITIPSPSMRALNETAFWLLPSP